MPSVAWPLVRAYLAGAAVKAALAGVEVIDGPVVSGRNPVSYLTVAHQPSSPDSEGGSFEQEVGPDGYSAIERGEVLCELAATVGSATMPDIFASYAAFAAHLQQNQTLGGALNPASTVTASASVVQSQTDAGAVQRLRISVSYFTRI